MASDYMLPLTTEAAEALTGVLAGLVDNTSAEHLERLYNVLIEAGFSDKSVRLNTRQHTDESWENPDVTDTVTLVEVLDVQP